MSQAELHAALADGAQAITANRRLARVIKQGYAGMRQQAGEQGWTTPDVLPLGAWLQQQWAQAITSGSVSETCEVLLGADQELLLWEQVIRRSRIGDGLLAVSATAESVARTWRLLHAWQMPLPTPADYPGEDALAFARWAEAYMRRCEQNRLVDMARLPARIAAWVGQDRIAAPNRQLWIGFERLTPQQSAVVKSLVDAAVKVEQVALPEHDSDAVRTACNDSEDELAHAAGWARDRLLENTDSRIAVVVPDLEARRTQVTRVFDDVLHPGSVLPGSNRGERGYNLSLGQPLSEFPLIRAAFNILRLVRGSIDLGELGTLLRSPFVAGGESEAGGRALLDVRLRERGEREVWLADFLGMARALAEGSEAEHALAPDFIARLGRLFIHHRDAVGQRPAAEWAALFSRCLSTLGWPGERVLDSEEKQQLDAWQALLDRYASLDVVATPMQIAPAIARLHRLAQGSLFQAQTPDRPIQVLGTLEALGQGFDFLWLCGMDDDSWPPATRPDPWLPISLQRRYRLPGSDAVAAREQARVLTWHLLTAATGRSVVSYGRWDSDRLRQPSPLIMHLPERAPDRLAEADTHLYRDLLRACQSLETLVDAQAPALTTEKARGGSGLLQAQAACPFQAFAHYRLQARALEESRTGVDARERGQLMHRVLERVWASLEDRAALLSLDDQARQRLIRGMAKAVVGAAARRRPRTYVERFVAIEIESLTALVDAWLRVEAQRPEFRVTAREQAREVTLAGLKLQIFIDRIDELEDGSEVVLDYKTGQVSVAGLDGARPEQPQLPLYALAVGRPAAVAYAQVRPGENRFVGVAREDQALPGVTAEAGQDWQARIQGWHSGLSALAAEHQTGEAGVLPLRYPQTCRYCDLTALCRIHQSDPARDDSEDELQT